MPQRGIYVYLKTQGPRSFIYINPDAWIMSEEIFQQIFVGFCLF